MMMMMMMIMLVIKMMSWRMIKPSCSFTHIPKKKLVLYNFILQIIRMIST